MAEKSTFIKLDRNILDWRWFNDANTLKLWIYLLAKANVKSRGFEDITVKRGQLVTSFSSLSKDLNMSVRSVRTALNHLKSTKEVTSLSTPQYTLVTVVNYNLYQDIPTNKLTNDRQATDKRPTNDRQQYKNVKNDKNVRSSSTEPQPPTQEDVFSYIAENGLAKVDGNLFYEHYRNAGWVTKSGKPITDWQSLLIRWNKTEKPKESTGEIASYDIDLFEKMINEKE